MADIFGKTPRDYKFIRAMEREKPGSWEVHCRSVEAEGGRPHNFDALGKAQRDGFRDFDVQNRAEVNAQALGFLTNNLEALTSMMLEIWYLGGRRIMERIPIMRDVEEGATSYAHQVIDAAGMGRYISAGSTDAPAARVAVRKVPVPLAYGAIDGEWTIENLRRAMFLSVPLDNRTIMAAMTGAINHIAQTAFLGDPTIEGHTRGLTNNASVTSFTAGTTDALTGSGTAQQCIDVIQSGISAVITGTNEVLPDMLMGVPLRIELPPVAFNRVVTLRYGEGSDMTVDRWVMMNNAWSKRGGGPVQFGSLREMAGANNPNLTNDRMLVYPLSEEVVQMAIAFDPRIIDIVNQGRRITAQIEYKNGPCWFARPNQAVQAVDNV